MRKNKVMRMASVLLVAVLLTTCMISGTFAKYISSAEFTGNNGGNGNSSALVAKWSILVNDKDITKPSANESAPSVYELNLGLFDKIWDTKDVTVAEGAAWPTEGTVESDVTAGKIAPGTWGASHKENEGTAVDSFVITNNSEVRVHYTVTGEMRKTVGTEVTSVDLPLEFSLDGGETWTTAITGEKDDKGDLKIIGLEGDLEIGASTTENKDGGATEADGRLLWRWVFDGNDEIDTKIGIAANGSAEGEAAAQFDFILKVVVEQID